MFICSGEEDPCELVRKLSIKTRPRSREPSGQMDCREQVGSCQSVACLSGLENNACGFVSARVLDQVRL